MKKILLIALVLLYACSKDDPCAEEKARISDWYENDLGWPTVKEDSLMLVQQWKEDLANACTEESKW